MKNIIIFTGHYGSGKTEVAINYAMEKAQLGYKTAICDLDIVNPYFRTKDAKEQMQAANITVICPQFANTNLDLPALPSQINALFDQDFDYVIFDVGGDADGAIALGAYCHKISSIGYELAVVANLKRPLTETCAELVDMVHSIQSASRLKASYFINNTNLSYETTPDTLLWHYNELEKAAKSLGIPILYITGTENVMEHLPKRYQSLAKPISIYLTPHWFND